MKQKFYTLHGWIHFQNDHLYFRSPYVPLSKTALAQFAYALFWPAALVLIIFLNGSSRRTLDLIFWSVLLLIRIPDIYDIFLKKSFANKIPLQDIRSYELTEDQYNMQTTLRLKLKNGRYKKIIFRNHENQLHPFIDAISPFLSQELKAT